MNKDLIRELGIDENLGLKGILEDLESKQFECLERLETVNDDNRRQELELQLSKIDKAIADVKEQIKSLKSGIILDDAKTSEPKDNVSIQKEVKPKEESKKEEVNQKVEALKAKEAEKQAKEAERKQKAAEKAAKEAQASVGLNQNTNASDTNANINADPDLTNALIDYKNGNYQKAFDGLKKSAEKDDETAQYMLSNMYRRGEGTQKNDERSEYWMKRSADGGYTSAQLDYGILKLANNNNDDAIIKEGIKYLGMAADKDEKQAMLKYIEIARKQLGGRSVYEKAINYCNKLKSQSSDSYDAAKYDEAKKDLELLRKDELSKERKVKLSTRFSIIGAVITILGALYLLGGIHPVLWETNKYLEILPNAGRFLILPINIIWNTLYSIMNQNGFFGLELILVGQLFVTAGDFIGKKKIAKVFVTIRNIACVAIIFWHFVAMVLEGNSIFTALGWYIIVVAIAYIVGRILGNIIGKIFKINT